MRRTTSTTPAHTQIRKLAAEYKRLRRAPPPKPKFFDEYDSVAVYDRDTPTTSLTLAAQFDPVVDGHSAAARQRRQTTAILYRRRRR